jgi:hypothetical protein
MSLRAYHVMGVLAVACLVVGSGAFTSASMERGISVSVADDEDALVGIVAPENDEVRVTDGERVNGQGEPVEAGNGKGKENGLRLSSETLLTLENNAGAELDLAVTIAPDGSNGYPNVSAAPDRSYTLAPGDSTDVTTEVVCNPSNAEPERTVTVEVDGAGDGISVSFERTVTVVCDLRSGD